MSKPAARIGDMHLCPMVTPGTPPVPHVGGPVTGPGCPTVLIGGMPAAVMGDMCVCTGPPDTIILGSTGVMIGGMPAARVGDLCAHGGSIAVGCPTVLIGEVGSGGVANMPVNVLLNVMKHAPTLKKDLNAIAAFKKAANSGTTYVNPERNAALDDPKKISEDSIKYIIKDEDGEPVEGVEYSLQLPDGRIVKGKSDKEGIIEQSGFKPGICKLTLKNLDGSEWEI
ncbi:MAG: PAAR domain-containing protein [Chitinophagaceae bacterium]|nr:PAAR domain-containing protein [Chitinophagaceae bacterium]